MNNLEQNNFSPAERNETGIRNEMQVRLATLGGLSFEEFMEKKYADKFGELVKNNHGLLDDYERNQEKTLEELKKIIYH